MSSSGPVLKTAIFFALFWSRDLLSSYLRFRNGDYFSAYGGWGGFGPLLPGPTAAPSPRYKDEVMRLSHWSGLGGESAGFNASPYFLGGGHLLSVFRPVTLGQIDGLGQ